MSDNTEILLSGIVDNIPIYSNPIWVVGINEPKTQAQQGANIITYLGLL